MPNPAVALAMAQLVIHAGTDCSEIADLLQSVASGAGTILHITPAPRLKLTLVEFGIQDDDFVYHDVFTDDDFAYDPRFDKQPVGLKGYLDGILKLNPGAVIAPR